MPFFCSLPFAHFVWLCGCCVEGALAAPYSKNAVGWGFPRYAKPGAAPALRWLAWPHHPTWQILSRIFFLLQRTYRHGFHNGSRLGAPVPFLAGHRFKKSTLR